MKLFVGGFIGLLLSVHVGAEPLLEGRVRLSSGQPAPSTIIPYQLPTTSLNEGFKAPLRSCLQTPAELLREAVKRLGYTAFFAGDVHYSPLLPLITGVIQNGAFGS